MLYGMETIFIIHAMFKNIVNSFVTRLKTQPTCGI